MDCSALAGSTRGVAALESVVLAKLLAVCLTSTTAIGLSGPGGEVSRAARWHPVGSLDGYKRRFS